LFRLPASAQAAFGSHGLKLLLAIVGVGAGNSTRNIALLDALRARDSTFEVLAAAQGKALELLRDRVPTHAMETVNYGSGGQYSALSMIRSNLSFPARWRRNVKAYEKLIASWKPDVVLADSDFYCLGPARRAGVPLVTLNNSAYIVETYKALQQKPSGCGFSFNVIERCDYWLQRRYANVTICPVLRPQEGLAEKFRQIEPIVRAGFAPNETNEPSDDLVVMLGGSSIGSGNIDLRRYPGPMTVLGKLEAVPPQAHVIGFQSDPLPWLRRARFVMIQGGFSSISDILALEKPAVIVPIAGHAEQHINAMTVEQLGLGIAAIGGTVEHHLDRLRQCEPEVRANLAARRGRYRGADQAADILMNLANR